MCVLCVLFLLMCAHMLLVGVFVCFGACVCVWIFGYRVGVREFVCVACVCVCVCCVYVFVFVRAFVCTL